ncbi:hypothetical protein GN956_G22241 [Arapaima gigas]
MQLYLSLSGAHFEWKPKNFYEYLQASVCEDLEEVPAGVEERGKRSDVCDPPERPRVRVTQRTEWKDTETPVHLYRVTPECGQQAGHLYFVSVLIVVTVTVLWRRRLTGEEDEEIIDQDLRAAVDQLLVSSTVQPRKRRLVLQAACQNLKGFIARAPCKFLI